MKKQEIMELEGTLIEEEQLIRIEESEEVIGFESYGYYHIEYQDCIGYMVTLADGTEIEIYSYF